MKRYAIGFSKEETAVKGILTFDGSEHTGDVFASLPSENLDGNSNSTIRLLPLQQRAVCFSRKTVCCDYPFAREYFLRKLRRNEETHHQEEIDQREELQPPARRRSFPVLQSCSGVRLAG
jgi:hypothetical protein